MPVTVCAIAREQEGQPPTHINGIYFPKHIVIKLDKKCIQMYMYTCMRITYYHEHYRRY